MAAVTLDQVRKSYGPQAIIHGVDCTIADGEFIVVVGPSGCGKSTLLRMIAGLETVTGGEIRIGPRRVNEVEPKDRDIAMVFQNYALYPHMSVFDNMAYGLKLRGLARPEIERRVAVASQMLRLDGLIQRKPRQLSGGQRQRVAMGRAIVREPQVFLFDEPLSNLDAQLRGEMRVEIKQLQRRLGTTAIYVTHDQVEAMTLADRLIVMKGGRAEQIGAPIELYDRPATPFVAGFIGAPPMNLLPARAAAGGIAITGGPSLAVPVAAPEGTEILVGIRPEHIEPGEAGGAPQILVHLVELLGADALLYGRLGPEGPSVVVRVAGHAAPAVGSAWPLRIPPDRLHLFEAASGRRL